MAFYSYRAPEGVFTWGERLDVPFFCPGSNLSHPNSLDVHCCLYKNWVGRILSSPIKPTWTLVGPKSIRRGRAVLRFSSTSSRGGLKELGKRTFWFCLQNIEVAASFDGFGRQNFMIFSCFLRKQKGVELFWIYFEGKIKQKWDGERVSIQIRARKSRRLLPRRQALHSRIVHSLQSISPR